MRKTTIGMACVAAIAVLAWGGAARANGMMWVEKSASGATGQAGKASPTAQRAVLDREGGAWNLTIEPKYVRPKAGAAWLIPFPHCPTVREGDPRVVEEVFLVTAPLFVKACGQTCYCDEGGSSGIGCFGGKAASEGDGDGDRNESVVQPGNAPVDVWQTGSIGSLDFVVVSSDEGESVTAWLDQNGYVVAPDLEAFVAANDAEYRCWFAARVAEGSGDADGEALPPVTFRLDTRDPLFYPLRLTRLGVPDGAALDLALVVVNPDDGAERLYHRIASHLADVPDCLLPPESVYDAPYSDDTNPDAAQWQACVDAYGEDVPDGRLSVTFHGTLDQRAAAFVTGRQLCDEQFWPLATQCLQTDTVLKGVPATWSDTMTRWAATGTRATRFEARLPAKALETDLLFEGSPWTPYVDVPAIYGRVQTSCGIPCDAICAGRYTPYGPDATAPDAPAEAGAAGIVLLLGLPLIVARARRRDRSAG